MIDQLLNSWQFNFWLGLASLGAGLVVVAPCLLVPSWRRRILRSDIDIEGVGLIALTVVIIAIGFYNYFVGR
jgi:threonine/homoserine/homoserine lactone efflux protein